MPTNTDKHKDQINGRTIRIPDSIADLSGYYSFELPTRSGSVSIRPMSGNEENILISRDNRKNPLGAFFDVLEACTKGLPFRDLDNGMKQLNLAKIWMDDMTFILFQLRRLTYGDYFTFHIDCPGCGQGYDWEEDLDDQECFYASEEQARVYSSEEASFDFFLPVSKVPLKYRMASAKTTHILQLKRQSDRDSLRTEALRMCVSSWNNSEAVPFVSEWAEIHAADLRFFEQDMAKNRVGINVSIDPVCPHCSTVASGISLPVDSADFLLMPRNLKLRPDGRLTTLWDSRKTKSSSSGSSLDSSSALKV